MVRRRMRTRGRGWRWIINKEKSDIDEENED